ncbi:MAG: type II secretion system protein [Ghiorsea sp.]|nr:type II secretion system protein [Ghiorsea sp.]
MILNQRISPNLSETSGKQQAQACMQGGFTLIELLAVIAILGILMAIGGTSWTSYREATRVDSAKEKAVSILQQARLKAISSGFTQPITVDFPANTIVGINGLTESFGDVDLQNFVCGTCTASDPALPETINFKSSGTATLKNIKVSKVGSSKSFILMINTATGRVDIRTTCVAGVCQ